jgi:hypothetical protein
MKKLILHISLLSALCLVPITYAQDKPALVTQIEKVFTETEPKWRIDRENVQLNPPVIHLKSRQGDALVYVWVTKSAKTAGEVFEGNTIAFGNTMGARGRKVKLPNFGDENYMFTGFVVSGTTSIHFRQGNVYIHVIAPSQVTAKRFAQHVMKQIIESSKSQHASS